MKEGPASSPYKFLHYFEEADQASFAGREDEVQEVLAGLTRGRTFVLYGRSGLGKTSLLLAGLFPRLRQRGFHPLRVRLLDSPVEDFRAALAAELRRPELARRMEPGEREEHVTRVLGELSAREPLVIVLDQFEEFFVRFRDRPAARAELVEQLGCLYREQAANVRLVFCLREDYYAELEDLRPQLPELGQYGLRLPPLTAYGARQAIVRPLQQAHSSYEEGFVNRLVDLLADWNFEPPVLQIVCTELCRDVVARRGPPVNLTREDLERLGGVDGIFRGYVHRVTSGLDAERLLLVRVVLDALISSERTRYALRAEELLAGPVRVEYGAVRAVLDHLTDQGLLRVEHRKGERWYELLHERLVPIVEAWLSTDMDYVRFRTAHASVVTLSEDPQWRTNPDWLLTASQLEERVDPWKEQLRLDEDQVEFLLRSSIHGQSDSVAYWGRRLDELGAGRSVQLMLGLLDHPDLSVRQGAAASCGQLQDASGRLATRSLELALADPDEAVRRGASRSFVRLAGAEQLAMLRGALERPPRQARALELLADLLEAGRPPEGVPERWLRQAKAIVRARRLERAGRTIRMRTLNGIRVGTTTALVWGFTVGLLEGAYWAFTLFPERVTVRWPHSFLTEVLWLLIDKLPFVFIPLGLILGWRVSRLAADTAAARGQEDWSASVRRSGTLLVSGALLYAVLLITVPSLMEVPVLLARTAGLSRGIVFFAALLVAAVLAWLLTVGVVLLGNRCITPDSKASTVYLFALLCSAAFPLTIDTLLCLAAWWAGLRTGVFHLLFITTIMTAAFVANFQSFIVLCVLGAERSRLARAPRRTTLWARAAVLAGVALFFAAFNLAIELDKLPGLGRHYPLASEVSLQGRIWQHEKDVEYFSLEAPPEGPFALSIHEGTKSRTRLVIGGQEVTSGMLLVSAWSRLLGAVVSLPEAEPPMADPQRLDPRTDYRYRIHREPGVEGQPGELRAGSWTFVMLPLERVEGGSGERPTWQGTLEGQLAPAQLEAPRGVHVLPVLVDIAGLEPGACMGVSSSASSTVGGMEGFVLTNRAGIERVPPPGPQTRLFAEGLRLAPGANGSWGTTLTLAPIMEFRPRECERPTAGPLASGAWQPPVPDLYGERPSLLVAVTLY